VGPEVGENRVLYGLPAGQTTEELQGKVKAQAAAAQEIV
jgi:hypothetical protein